MICIMHMAHAVTNKIRYKIGKKDDHYEEYFCQGIAPDVFVLRQY